MTLSERVQAMAADSVPRASRGPDGPTEDPAHLEDGSPRKSVNDLVDGDEAGAPTTSVPRGRVAGERLGSCRIRPGSWADMATQTSPPTSASHCAGGGTAATPGRDEAAALRHRSVRQLIAELAGLEDASRSTAPVLSLGRRARNRTREGLIGAELRRRHAALGRWSFGQSRVAAPGVGELAPPAPAVDPRGQWLGSG